MLSAPAARRGGACGHPLRPPYITRYYRPLELREVIGNVTIDDVRNKARCQKRGSCEWISAQLFHPRGMKPARSGFRRLVQIRCEKRVIWRDE
jgi:hypothetical protein